MFDEKNNLVNEETVYFETAEQEKPKMSFRKKIIIVIVSVVLALVLSLSVFIFTLFNVKKNYEQVASLVDLPSPVQVETTGEIVKQVGGYEVKFNLKAAYTINALVVEKYYYAPYKIENRLSRFDLGLVWGPLLGEELDEYMSFKNDGKRFLNYKYSNELVQKLGSRDAVVDSLSNNHMVHADETVLKCLRDVREGDYIKIEGFLVYITMENDRQIKHWDSSLSRTDHGEGACEVIYVTSVTWLSLV